MREHRGERVYESLPNQQHLSLSLQKLDQLVFFQLQAPARELQSYRHLISRWLSHSADTLFRAVNFNNQSVTLHLRIMAYERFWSL